MPTICFGINNEYISHSIDQINAYTYTVTGRNMIGQNYLTKPNKINFHHLLPLGSKLNFFNYRSSKLYEKVGSQPLIDQGLDLNDTIESHMISLKQRIDFAYAEYET